MTRDQTRRRTNTIAVAAIAVGFALALALAVAYLVIVVSDQASIQATRLALENTVSVSVTPSHYFLPADNPNFFYEANEPFEITSADLGERLSDAFDVRKTV